MAGSEENKGSQPFKEVADMLGKTIADVLRSNTQFESIKKEIYDLDTRYSTISRTMGVGRESAIAIKTALADSYSSIAKLGGGYAEISEIQKSVINNLNRNVIVSSDYFEKLYATELVTGQKSDSLIKNFKEVGFSLYSIAEQMEGVVSRAREVGVSAQAVSSMVMTNMSKLNLYNFSNGVDGLSKMAVQAASMRIDMGEIFKSAEKAFKPEGAIEMAAAFQRLGVQQSNLLDPLRLMNMAENNPEELQESLSELSKSFTELDAKTGRIRIMPGAQRRMREVAQAAGIGVSEFAKMAIGAGELDLKLNKIKFPEFATEEQKEFLANITEIGKGGEMKIKVGGLEQDLEKVLKEVGGDKDKFEKLIEASKPVTMEDLAKQQLDVQTKQLGAINSLKGVTGRAIGSSETGEMLIKTSSELTEKTTGLFQGEKLSPKTIREGIDSNLGEFLNVIEDISKGKGTIEDVGKVVSKMFTNMSNYAEETFTEMSEIFKKNKLDLQTSSSAGSRITGNLLGKDETVQNKSLLFLPSDESTKNQNLPEGKVEEKIESKREVSVNGALDLNVKIDAPPTMDSAKLNEIINSTEFREKLIKIIDNAKTSDGQLKPK